MATDEEDASIPRLLIIHGQENQKHSFFSISEKKHYCTTFDPLLLHNMDILDSRFGWVVIRDKKTRQNYHLFDPVSAEKIDLPPLISMNYNASIVSVLLSKPPRHPNCRVFIVGYGWVAYCSLNLDESFVEFKVSLSGCSLMAAEFSEETIYGMVMVEGNFTFVTLDVDIATGLELMVKPLVQIDFLLPMGYLFTSYMHFMIDLGGELLYVMKVVYHESIEFRVFLLNTEKKCVELECIGRYRAIFLSESGTMSCIDTTGSMFRGNCIYYLEKNDKRLYVHYLENKSRLLELPCPNAETFCWVQMSNHHQLPCVGLTCCCESL